MNNELFVLAERLGNVLKSRRLTIATAESCTGGLISSVLTEVPGSSSWFDRGFVTYSNQSKIDMLGVNPETLGRFGAVSAETAKEMVSGALAKSQADLAVAVTGIAGPDGGSKEKPVGTVYIAWQYSKLSPDVSLFSFKGDRPQIRRHSVVEAIEKLLQMYI